VEFVEFDDLSCLFVCVLALLLFSKIGRIKFNAVWVYVNCSIVMT